jgi:acetyl/propionyl-CoA carboxylase alpha subunit/acetyl-CoA carboxylase carboxyltransferase component
MFTRVAVVNRGEAAMRFLRAAREITLAGDHPVTTIALYTDEERAAMFVREADEAVRIVSRDKNAYLDYDELERALVESGAEAVWVGWGFVSEQADFADRVAALGLTFMGPTGDVMRRLGDKIGAKVLAEKSGVPVAAWSGGPVESVQAAEAHGEVIGYPLMIKAAAGGGGRGIRRVERPGDLREAYESARREAAGAFGDSTVFMERVVSGARHVEVQVIADRHGTVWTPGVRDCSVQRRNQKVVEESASTALAPVAEERARAAAVDLARAAGYQGAGTVEFLYQPEEDLLAFLEVNTRLQVEHPVTELTTGIDLVKLQVHVARGGRLGGGPPAVRGHAIEVRLNAEDPDRGFAPSPGKIERLVWAAGPGIRVDTGVAQGDVIPATYDSMVAKIIGYGADREEARARVRRALAETTVVVRGGTTNKAFLAFLLDHPDLVGGRLDTGWLDRLMEGGGYRPPQHGAVALIAAAIDSYESQREEAREAFFAAAARGRPQTDIVLGHRVDLRFAGSAYVLTAERVGADRYRVGAGDHWVEVQTERVGPFERRLNIGARTWRAVSIRHGPEAVVEVDGLLHRVQYDDGGLLRAPSPGVVVSVLVQPGQVVEAGQRLVTFESMKMEVALSAPAPGRVRDVLVAPNTQLNVGEPILRLEAVAESDGAAQAASADVDFGALLPGSAARHPVSPVAAQLAEMRSLVLGYDVDAAHARRAVRGYELDRPLLPDGELGVRRQELGVLNAFTQLSVLSRNRRVGPEEAAEERHNSTEYFNAFLGTLDATRAGLPSSFEEKLRRMLTNYGVESLEVAPALREALLLVYLAQRRSASQVPAVMAILSYHLGCPEDLPDELRQEFLDTLDQLIVATQLRHPAVGDLARRVRFRIYDEALLHAARRRVEREMLEHLSVLTHSDDPEVKAERIRLLVECPHQLIRLAAQLPDRGRGEWRTLVEVQTRRYYQTRDLGDLQSLQSNGFHLLRGTFRHEGSDAVVVAADADNGPLGGDGGVLAACGAAAMGNRPAVVEVYMPRPAGVRSRDELGHRLAAEVASSALPAEVKRVTFTVSDGGDNRVARRSFVRDGDGFVPNRALDDLHPLIAERLHLWRLDDFTVERRPAPDDVYLFDCTARDNPGDRRLVALAEVRDLTPLRNASGAVAALPGLEHVLDSCLDGMRLALAGFPDKQRPEWNRIDMYVWPPIDLPPEDWVSVFRSLAPRTDGVGLEEVTIQGTLAGPGAGAPGGGGAGEGGLGAGGAGEGGLGAGGLGAGGLGAGGLGAGGSGPGPRARGLGSGADGPEVCLRMSRSAGVGLTLEVTGPPTEPLRPMDAYTQKVIRSRRRDSVYPYEMLPLLGRGRGDDHRPGEVVELDLDDAGTLVPVTRAPGNNSSAIVVATVSTPTTRYPEGMRRVVLLGDPTKALGSVAEPECRRIIAALDLAQAEDLPVEWFAVCSGAKIAMDSGTENLDWVGRVLRRLVEFTQAGGEVNVVVAGINVGAQPYWNAEATMLMHTKGILIMTPDSAMVLTGKQALEYSGGVSAEDNFGIGGYDRVMGPNGQAQYWAPDLASAAGVLIDHYEFAYVAPGERHPRRAVTTDPVDRDVRAFPHQVEGTDLSVVGDIFSDTANPDRKKAFDMRTLMRAVTDQDHPMLERWAETRDAETAIVTDVFLGGYPVTLIGIESRPLPRLGQVPADGPSTWSGGTLYPLSSRKVARGINAASGNRPVVVLANLSGFDGSPESLRNLQLEYGAEIGRAVVNFEGPIVFCVVSRYHGGAFVVFSACLNDNMEVAAVEGSFASVLGGGPAAAVVFAAEVNRRADQDPRVATLRRRIDVADEAEAATLVAELDELRAQVRQEKQAEVAGEFDAIHSVARAKEVGSVHAIIPAGALRPYLVDAVERGLGRGGAG